MKERIKGAFTKKKILHVLKMALFVVALSLILLSLLGTVAHATGLVDDTINAENLYSKYPLSNYQLDFYVDNSWSWLPWNWLDGIGKSVQYGLYCITNFVWTISLYLSNATGYVVQEAYKLDFINDMADSIGKSIQTLAGVTENGFSSSGFYVGFLLLIILVVGLYVAYTGLIKRETSKALHAVINFVVVFVLSASFIAYAPDYIKKINEFSSDISTASLDLGTKIMLPNSDSEGKCINDVSEIDAIGHRVVHGGEKFKSSCLITDEVIETLRELSPLAPLHNPAGILGIEAARKVFGNIPMVAVFDTAFHSTMPPKAYMYAIPYEYYEKYGVRRYGFHGTSHKYVAHKAAEYLEEPIERLKLITCHLGNGSSIAAVDQGKVVDTSMGMTPLAGLMMGTRCGDLDPSVVNYLKYTLNITGHELDEILNKKSGLLGISGVSSDKRDVEEAAAAGNERAQLASDMLNYQIKKTIGAYIAAMGGVDAIVFTGGIGEHDAIARAKICHHMDWLGIRIDTEKNKHPVGDVCEITAWGAKVRTLVIATDEELMIARDTKEVIEK